MRDRIAQLEPKLAAAQVEFDRLMLLVPSPPLAEVPEAEPRALRQAERAIGETVEHHGHVRCRPAVAA